MIQKKDLTPVEWQYNTNYTLVVGFVVLRKLVSEDDKRKVELCFAGQSFFLIFLK